MLPENGPQVLEVQPINMPSNLIAKRTDLLPPFQDREENKITPPAHISHQRDQQRRVPSSPHLALDFAFCAHVMVARIRTGYLACFVKIPLPLFKSVQLEESLPVMQQASKIPERRVDQIGCRQLR